MDQLLSFGKTAFQEYEQSQNRQQHHEGSGGGDFGVQGSSQLNSDTNGRTQNVNVDSDEAANHAANQSGQDPEQFAAAMHHVQNTSAHGDIDEQGVQDAHAAAYSNDGASNLPASGMGAAAAMQALKMFSGGGGSSGGGQSALIGTAMSEAAKLFDQSGGGAGGSKQEAIQSAGQMVMKLLMKQQLGGLAGGSSSSGGGLSSLMSMASKFA